MYGLKNPHNGPYTYIVKHLATGRLYYGVRYAQGCSTADLWSTYFTSSKEIHRLINETGLDSFYVEIRKTFTTYEQAINWEGRFLRRINARANPLFINKHNNDGLIGLYGEDNPMKNKDIVQKWKKSRQAGNKHYVMTESHKQAIARSLRGRKRTEEECIAISRGLTGLKRSKEYKEQCRERQIGVVPSEQNKSKKSLAIKGRKKYTNGQKVITAFPGTEPEGFYLKSIKGTV